MTTQPRPGDRVRVTETYEGVWTSRGTHGSGMWGVVAAKDFDVDFQVTNYAKVEVLPKLIYSNHSATEPRYGDVVRDRRGDVWLYGTAEEDPGWTPTIGLDQISLPDGPLILLVRDGQVIAA